MLKTLMWTLNLPDLILNDFFFFFFFFFFFNLFIYYFFLEVSKQF